VRVAYLYDNIHQYDSALAYAKAAFDSLKNIPSNLIRLQAANFLCKLYQQKQNKDSVLFYLAVASTMKDSLYGPDKVRQLQLLALDEQKKQQKILLEQGKQQMKQTALENNFLLAGI